MSVSSLLLPVFVQVALTFVLFYWMARLRTTALRTGVVEARDIALREPNWPERATRVANCFHNQLELPMLFYAVVGLILITSTNSFVFVLLAWIFVLARLTHAYIHTGHNDVWQRGTAMGVGSIALLTMWVVFAARILAADGS
jgi:hypothetical protein